MVVVASELIPGSVWLSAITTLAFAFRDIPHRAIIPAAKAAEPA
jgi:hypothetical protein